jgi:hypothetical protein
MKTYGGEHVQIHVFLTLTLAGSEWSFSRLCRFTPQKELHAQWVGGWQGPRDGLEDMENWQFLPYQDLNSDPSIVQLVASEYANDYI